MRSRMSESGVEYVVCSPEEALAMVRDDASSSSSTSSRVSDACNAPELLPRTVNGTGHTGPSEFCATSI